MGLVASNVVVVEGSRMEALETVVVVGTRLGTVVVLKGVKMAVVVVEGAAVTVGRESGGTPNFCAASSR